MALDAHLNMVILAGGASSRMKRTASTQSGLSGKEIKQANERSKGLIGVGRNGRPMLDYLLFNAKKAGYQNIYIVIGEQGELFKEFYGAKIKDNAFHGLTISFAVQYIPVGRIRPLGTADALCQAVEQFPGLNTSYYTVCNSDNLYSIEALKALRNHNGPNALVAYDRDALQFPQERISRFAVTRHDGKGHLLDIIEKPSEDEIEQYKDALGTVRVSMNAFKFSGERMYPYLKDCPLHPDRNEKELPTAFLNMLKDHPRSAVGLPFSEHVPDLTAKEDIPEVKKYLEEHFVQLDWDDI